MRHTPFFIPLFVPDIMEYITGRDIVCQLVLEECKTKPVSAAEIISLKSELFTELHFSAGDIVEIIVAVGRQLKVKFSYKLILHQGNYFTVEDLATQLWKYMCRVVKCN